MTPSDFWNGRRVLITGHTGFKGTWLAAWLLRQGAEVHGIALAPETAPSLFQQIRLADRMASHIGDIRDLEGLRSLVADIQPEIVFHLAAQALVRQSYADPLGTWSTNVMGTANLLEAVTRLDASCTVLAVTTDKVYRNEEWVYAYRETDRLGGHDPYSASKAGAELLLDSWRASFLRDGRIRLAVGRAGNVIGGGDWAWDRIVPDLIRSLMAGKPLQVRNPAATRPWQHALEPLNGYMALAEAAATSIAPQWHDAFNFGPEAAAQRSVGDLVSEALKHWPGCWDHDRQADAPHEAGRLALSIEKARVLLGWRPRWDFERTVAETMHWYRAVADGADPWTEIETQIAAYEAAR